MGLAQATVFNSAQARLLNHETLQPHNIKDH